MARSTRVLLGFAGLAALLLLGALLPGCVKKTAVPENGLVLYLRATPEQLKLWQEAVTKFTEQSKIPVVIQNETYEHYWSKLQTMVAGGSPPDVVFMESTRFPEFATKGTLLNLDPYLKQQTALDPADFYPAAWESYQYQGNCYGIPNDVAVIAMAYNQELFELSLLKSPTAKWTWDDYLKAAQAITGDKDGDGRVETFGTTVCPWWQLYVWQNGGDVVDNPLRPTRSTLSTAAAQEALQWLADLSLKHKVAPSAALTESTGRVELFTSGRIGMIYAGRWDMPQIGKQAKFMWMAAPLPRGKRAANLGLGSGFCVMKGSKQPDNAWKLTMFLAGLEGQQALLEGSFSTPAYKPLSLTLAAVGAKPEEDPYLGALQVAHPVPYTTQYTAIADVWEQELQLLWSGQSSVAEVTKKIDDRVNQLLAETAPATAWLQGLIPRG